MTRWKQEQARRHLKLYFRAKELERENERLKKAIVEHREFCDKESGCLDAFMHAPPWTMEEVSNG